MWHENQIEKFRKAPFKNCTIGWAACFADNFKNDFQSFSEASAYLACAVCVCVMKKERKKNQKYEPINMY